MKHPFQHIKPSFGGGDSGKHSSLVIVGVAPPGCRDAQRLVCIAAGQVILGPETSISSPVARSVGFDLNQGCGLAIAET